MKKDHKSITSNKKISLERMHYWALFFMRNMAYGRLRKHETDGWILQWPCSGDSRALPVPANELRFVRILMKVTSRLRRLHNEQKKHYEEMHGDDDYPEFSLMIPDLSLELIKEKLYHFKSLEEFDALFS